MTTRKKLPQRRKCDTFRMSFQQQRGSYHVTIGYYGPDQGERAGELFINSPKVGSPMDSLARACAVLVSIALQHGATAKELADALPMDEKGEQSTVIGAALEEIMKRKLDTFNYGRDSNDE